MEYALKGFLRTSPNYMDTAKNNSLDFVVMCNILTDTMNEKDKRFGLESI